MDKRIFFTLLLSGGLATFSNQIFAQTTSPFEPPEEELGVYVVNSGSGLDTGCTYRSGGPLRIQLEVPATMNPAELNPDGTLKDASKLINNKVIGEYATISFPTFDIDDKANVSRFSPEIDHVYFNGEYQSTLEGLNGTWVNDSFKIHISKVKFNETNEIRVDIDTANSGEYWCMAVDWVAIEFDAAAPYVLAHGIDAQSDTWDEDLAPGVLTTMDDSGVLYNRFSTGEHGAVSANARDLKSQISNWLDSTKTKAEQINIIAHSKGGLDSQYLAKISNPEFEVLSLSTLSTPHKGSVVADLQIIQRQAIDVYVNNGQDPNGHAQEFATLSLAGWSNRVGLAGPRSPGIDDLTTRAAISAKNAGVRGNVAKTFTIGADAGPVCTRLPTADEISPMVPFGAGWLANEPLQLAYQAICEFSSAVETGQLTQWHVIGTTIVPITTLTYETVTTTANRPNDIVVSVDSAHPSNWGTTPVLTNVSTNHSEVKNGANVQQFLDRTIKLR